MSNPVAPPPAADQGGFPPPANQGFGAAPDGQPGQPQQGFGPAPAGVPAEPKKKSAAGRIVLRIALILVVAVVGAVVKFVIFGDKAQDAKVGDCIASSKDVKVNEETDADAKVVDCGSADAAFSVVGRINGETDTNSKSCDKFFKEDEEFFVYSSEASGGYLLCLKPKS